jgi:hypothetical protein
LRTNNNGFTEHTSCSRINEKIRSNNTDKYTEQ